MNGHGFKVAGKGGPDVKPKRIIRRLRGADGIAKNPLMNLPDTGTVQGNAKQDVAVIQTAFMEAMKKQSAESTDRRDTEYWFCAVFTTREQKEAFLIALGISDIADKYVDGYLLADRCNIALPANHLKFTKPRISRSLADLAAPVASETSPGGAQERR